MKKFTMLMAAALVGLSASAWTVKFTNPDNWTEVPLTYMVAKAQESLGKWPGTVMTETDGVWELTSPNEKVPEKIIFNNNNNGKQTGNLDFVLGATYDMNGVVGAEMQTYTVYFNDEAGWGTVYVYAFPDIYTGAWPGKELSKNSEGMYEWSVEATSAPSLDTIIFNNGNNGLQTDDLTYEVGKTYTNGGGSVVGPTPDYSTWYVNVYGPFNGWADNGVNPVDGISTTENLPINAEGFKIKIWNGTADLFYSALTEIPVGEWVQFYEDGSNQVTTIAGANAETVYNVEYDVKNNMCKVTMVEAAVNTIEAANGEAVYFNLQSARVANPEAGLYIRVANGKAQKVLVK